VIAVLLLLFGRGKISELMATLPGIKAFRRACRKRQDGWRDQDSEPGKTIEHQPAETVAQTETRKAG